MRVSSYVACQQVSAHNSFKGPPFFKISDNTFPGALEEESDDKDLQTCHGHDQARLHQTEVEYPLLGTFDGAEVAVLASAEVLLVA